MAYNLDDADAQQVACIAQLQVLDYLLTSLTRLERKVDFWKFYKKKVMDFGNYFIHVRMKGANSLYCIIVNIKSTLRT
jgi:hypothetical protein